MFGVMIALLHQLHVVPDGRLYLSLCWLRWLQYMNLICLSRCSAYGPHAIGANGTEFKAYPARYAYIYIYMCH